MSDFDPIQYCADGMDITSSPYAEQDATEIRAWTETGDLIASVELNTTTGDWEVTEGPGQEVGTVIGADLANPREAALDYVRSAVPSDEYITTMVDSYIEAALWATSDTRPEDPEDATPRPLDDDFDASDLTSTARDSIESDCEQFATDNWADLKDMDPGQAGHDFLLTRDGHGAGFWDRGLGDKGDRLTAACKPWGESGLYVGDSGDIHTTNESARCTDCGCDV